MNTFRLDDEDEKELAPPTGPNTLVESALFKSRTILLTGGVDFKQARMVCERLLALSAESDEPILMILSSPGGHVESGDMIHDMIKFVTAPVKVLGSGWVASAGALIYAAAQKENRYSLPNTRYLLHEPRGGVGGQATDVEIQAREIIKMRERLNRIFAEATGKTVEQIKKDTERDFWMGAQEAVEYGLVSKIIRNRREIS
ncbi:MAG: ATP-dependent Clp protease proteolytic subunit [Hyphomonas sp.]